MLRDRLNEHLKTAIRNKDQRAVCTVRLILAAIKDRDICARGRGEEVGEAEILTLLQSMIKQRRDSIAMYEQGCRMDLAEQEQEEVEIIQSFLPHQMTSGEIESAVDSVIGEIKAAGLKDMGRVMAALRSRYAGQMDFGQASATAKNRLA
ncbi:GatB/YqeY domain-containing protein [Roseospira navarrensis]|uniref:GatB/YqeY domain-containing protein n=1 Tax=Roseospira navarrensis TaxID=140058 RepID=A0A7X1ZEX7_9PROT|nr:GatB/YqeY domain-containing protein [Roseospira navarrensis]MQX35985.1 GatB/YqeY domain-containing protein [Roseospira navarrensis]